MQVQLNIVGEEMQHAQLELLIKISAQQKSIFSLMCEVLGKEHRLYKRIKAKAEDLTLPDIYIDGVAAVQNKQLELLLETLSSLRSTSAMLVEEFGKTESGADELWELVEKCKHENYNSILYDLYERRGTLDSEIYQQLQSEGREINEVRSEHLAAGEPVTARRASSIVLLKKIKDFFYK